MHLPSRIRQIISGLAALGGLTLLVVGVPLALWQMVGWPLPSSMPAWADIRETLGRSDLPDATLIKMFAVVGWLAWLQVASSAVVEVLAWIRGRPAPDLPSAGAVQPRIRKLVATAAMLISTATPHVTGASASAATAPVPVELVLDIDRASTHLVRTLPSVWTEPTGVTTQPSQVAPTHIVQRRDTLWGLAESHLSDPFRWPELLELNQGVPQADGGALCDADLIRTGWVLAFPADATGLLAPPTVPTRTSEAPAAQPVSIPDPEEVEPIPPADPSASTIEAPATTDAPVSTTPHPPAATVVPAADGAEASEPGSTIDNAARGPRVPLPVVGGGLLAASLLVLLSRLRQTQQRRRKPGQRARQPRPDLAPIETAIRVTADLDSAQLLDLGLRAFLNGITPQASEQNLSIQAVRILDGRLEILLDQPLAVSPEGFEDLGERRAWQTERSITIERLTRLAEDSSAPLPSLVALGEADGGEVLIDLETAGLLAIDGPVERSRALIRRLTTEAATSTWADHLDIITADPRLGDLTGTQRTRNVDTVEEAIDELAAAKRLITAALRIAGMPNTLAARASGYGTADWTPAVFLHAEPLTPNQLERLRTIVGTGGRGVAAVVAADHSTSEWAITLGETAAQVKPIGLTIIPHILTADTAASIDELLTDTAVDDPARQTNDAADEADSLSARPVADPPMVTAPYIDPPFDIEVRVLGDVDIAGATVDRRKIVELLAYLTLHPGGVTDEHLKTALWPNQAPSTATFNTTISQARHALGRRTEDILRFPHFAATGGLYRLDASVTCDALRFEARAKHARHCEPADAIETLHDALELVRRMPFSAPAGFEWAHTEGLIASYEAMISDAAHRLATLQLEHNDPDGATWAAMQGLKVSPGNEVLYRDRMLASHLAGNVPDIKTILNELCEVVEANEPYDSLQRETLDLYEHLAGQRRKR